MKITNLEFSEIYSEKTKARILKSIDVEENSCWVWKKSKNTGKQSHGRIAVMNFGKRIHALVHRVVYYLWNGKIPDGLYIMHKCNNPSCCNPEHLEAGDQKRNMAFMKESGRDIKNPPKGERNPRSVFKESEVLEVRKLHNEFGYGAKRLSKLLERNRGTIQDIILHKTWRHI